MDKALKKLSGWQTGTLSLVGRLTLVKSIFFSLPQYSMQSSLLPKATINDLNRISHRFLWDGDSNSKKMHAISWKVVCRPKYRGLSIKPVYETKIAYMMKLVRSLQHENNL